MKYEIQNLSRIELRGTSEELDYFLRWQVEVGVYPEVTLCCGLGRFIALYTLEDAECVLAYLGETS